MRPATDCNKRVVCIVDAMAELQKIATAIEFSEMKTFGDVANYVVKGIIGRLEFAHEVHFVFDRYDGDPRKSPKILEQLKRSGFGAHEYTNLHPTRTLPPWKKVVANNQTKALLTDFLSLYFERYRNLIPVGKFVFFGGGYTDRQLTRVVSSDVVRRESTLSCDHTEADTRIIVHAVSRSRVRQSTVFVESPDTDVFILLLGHYRSMACGTDVWFHTGVGDERRFIPIHCLDNALMRKDPLLSKALFPMHALTGCDTNSSLYYVTKETSLKGLLATPSADLELLIQLPTLQSASVQAATRFIARLYDPKMKFAPKHSDINALRAQLAFSTNKTIEKLPPSEPALLQFITRGAWQTDVWLNAGKQFYTPKDPTEMGWCLKKDSLQPVFFKGQTSMQFLSDYFCNCNRRKKCKENCTCGDIGCCELCSCDGKCSKSDNSDELCDDENDDI